jgi:hypothetical protein
MKKKYILLVDALINLVLGILLLLYSPSLAAIFGIPPAGNTFYINILGGVFIGITAALCIEAFRKTSDRFIGLGLIGALCINICGGIVLSAWLIFGNLNIPVKGSIILWTIAGILLVVSTLESILEILGAQRG